MFVVWPEFDITLLDSHLFSLIGVNLCIYIHIYIYIYIYIYISQKLFAHTSKPTR